MFFSSLEKFLDTVVVVLSLIYLGFMPSFFMMPRTYFCDTLSYPLLLISAAILGDP